MEKSAIAHKHVLFRSAAREKILQGASALADAIRVTLGPKSKSVLIEKKWGKPIVCNDGVTIAKEFELEDSEENLGAQMIREAAEKTGEVKRVDEEAGKAEGDERTGLLILKRALEAPARQIAENSSVDGGVVVDKMMNGSGNYGLDAACGQYCDLIEAGIIDPTKVVRVALENAVSVASVLLLTEATLTEVPEKKAERSAMLDQMPV